MTTQLQTRTHFSESMHNDFFTVNGLQSSTGQTSRDFGNVVLKELIDNALDACESAGLEPRINVAANYTANGQMVLSVSDNGAGLDGSIVEKILDFDTRTSDKAAYKSPTRGAQGNALKTIFGIPTALGGGLVTIESKGLRHEISFNVSQSGLNVETLHNVTPIIESIGTTIKVLLPKLTGTKPDYWVKAFALFNSHCWVYFDSEISTLNAPLLYPKLTDCKKITPNKPTNAHSYNETAFLKHAGLHGEQTKITVYEYARTFQGLTNKKIVQPIIDALNLSGARMADIYNDRSIVGALHDAMKLAQPKPIQHGHLGAIGEKNLVARLSDVTKFKYKKIEGFIDGVPYVFEVLIADCSDREGEFLGVNHSPTYNDFLSDCWFSVDKFKGMGIRGLMDSVIDRTKYTFICHLIGIGLNFKDKGKTSVELPYSVQDEIAAVIVQVGKSIKHGAGVVRMDGEKEPSFKAACFEVLNNAIAIATDNDKTPMNTRGVYYKVRELIQSFKTKPLLYDTFTDILTQFWAANGRNKKVYSDARGLMYEPHSGVFLPLGSMEVDGYEFPQFQFDKILFIEKKGLWHTVKAAGLHKKYDMAVIGSEGFATVAIRDLLERAQTCENMTIFALHDADPAGYEIARTLKEATRTMPNHNITVIDLGLFVQDALDIGIEPETFERGYTLSKELNLNAIEREFFEGVPNGKKYDCKRIELNALAGRLGEYVDGKIARAIAENGLTNKVIPPEKVLSETAIIYRNEKLEQLAMNALIEKYGIKEKVNQFVQSMTFDYQLFTGDIGGYLISNELETWRDGLNDLTDKQIAANQGVIDDLIVNL